MTVSDVNLDLKKSISMNSKLSDALKLPCNSRESSRKFSMMSVQDFDSAFKPSTPKAGDSVGINLEMQSWLRQKIEECGRLEIKEVGQA